MITKLHLPSGPGIRVDSGVYDGWSVPVDYDPMLAKIVTWAATRDDAIERAALAMETCFAGGIRTNATLFPQLLRSTEFRQGHLHTGLLAEWMARQAKQSTPDELLQVAAYVASQRSAKPRSVTTPASSRWLSGGRSRLLR
ncbi:MAG: hypothetical protein WKF37_04455 [Bryobacteraceae bacterium]